VNLTRTGGLAVAAAASLAVIAAGLAPAAAHVAPRGSAAPAVTHYNGTQGVARLLPRATQHATGVTRMLWRGSRPSGRTFSATETVPRAPGTAASRGAAAAAATLSNFNGTSSRDSEFTNYNLEFEPPDQGLCAANGFVLEPVNSAYRIFRTNGTSVRGPFNVNDLFNVGGKEFTSDPRCWYDPGSGTFTRSMRPTEAAAAARASVTSPGSASTSRTCTSPPISSPSRDRSSTAVSFG
jgi:hypothetical protein